MTIDCCSMKTKQSTSSKTCVCECARKAWLYWFTFVLVLWCFVQVFLLWVHPPSCSDTFVAPVPCSKDSTHLPPRNSPDPAPDGSVELTSRIEEAIQTRRRPLLVRFKPYTDDNGLVYVGYGGITALEMLRPYGYQETESHEWVGKWAASSGPDMDVYLCVYCTTDT